MGRRIKAVDGFKDVCWAPMGTPSNVTSCYPGNGFTKYMHGTPSFSPLCCDFYPQFFSIQGHFLPPRVFPHTKVGKNVFSIIRPFNIYIYIYNRQNCSASGGQSDIENSIVFFIRIILSNFGAPGRHGQHRVQRGDGRPQNIHAQRKDGDGVTHFSLCSFLAYILYYKLAKL